MPENIGKTALSYFVYSVCMLHMFHLQSYVYPPPGIVAESGAPFHIVLRKRDTFELYLYMTKLYKPSKVSRYMNIIPAHYSHKAIYIHH